MSDLLELVDVHRRFNAGKPNEVRVLEGVDFTLKAGEVAALVAPSGAGKSTLLHIAGLLDKVDSGEIRYEGVAVSAKNDGARTKLRRDNAGFVYQFHHLLPEFTALENVVLPQLAAGTAKTAARARAAMLLEKVGLKARIKHRPSELSGGEQQRVAFCRALANSPKILLADEPTGNLDPDTANIVFNVLLELVRDTGMSALIATHNHELAARMDRVLHMDHGKVT